MRNALAAIGFAPVLIAQALYVRRVTLRLPEPLGERSGQDLRQTGPEGPVYVQGSALNGALPERNIFHRVLKVG